MGALVDEENINTADDKVETTETKGGSGHCRKWVCVCIVIAIFIGVVVGFIFNIGSSNDDERDIIIQEDEATENQNQ